MLPGIWDDNLSRIDDEGTLRLFQQCLGINIGSRSDFAKERMHLPIMLQGCGLREAVDWRLETCTVCWSPCPDHNAPLVLSGKMIQTASFQGGPTCLLLLLLLQCLKGMVKCTPPPPTHIMTTQQSCHWITIRLESFNN